ncbi:hypothetical protein Mapa_009473 [Marchantia paleacea]|nr:hypothetical protein Mapa_009473 [Marchantia paleacea]
MELVAASVSKVVLPRAKCAASSEIPTHFSGAAVKLDPKRPSNSIVYDIKATVSTQPRIVYLDWIRVPETAKDNINNSKPQVTPYQLWTRKSSPSHVSEEKLAVVRGMTSWATENLLPLLKPVEKCWQPQDYLPSFSSPTFSDEVRALQQRTANLPDDYLVCLVGDMITEEALPTYQTMLNTFEGVRDSTVCSPEPWAVWLRGWTSEESRHGDLLNKYLYLSGRVDMRMIEKTTQYLIGSGMAPQINNDPYNGFIYTSFQERATYISHDNTATHAKHFGDRKLATICKMIAADEKRHEIAYTRVMSRIFELDPSGSMLAFEDMMKKKITMPAHLMFDGDDEKLFENYAQVAQRLGVYTAADYVSIMEHLIRTWKVESLVGLTPEAQRAQDFVCNLPTRFRRLAERSNEMTKRRGPPVSKSFSWVFNKEVKLL